ncbi:DUF4260 family protein [Promicromonospora sp. NPDC050880]|uniref:DUF4260 family protein n=1 Tax=Promicromonospora sp. NPDC050880 TaxID=3364406 RepID=UPI00379BE324
MSSPRPAQDPPRPGGLTGPIPVQRIESVVIAALALVAALVLYPDRWWMVLAVFLAFDLSMLGYLRSPAAGAASYNAVHNTWPAIAATVALLTATSSPAVSSWCGLLACAWAFHTAFDRAIGAGLKLPDAFGHTHLS